MQTAPPGQLVVMLYDGAIRFLERANVGFQHDDPLEFNATINNNVLRAQEITDARRQHRISRGGEDGDAEAEHADDEIRADGRHQIVPQEQHAHHKAEDKEDRDGAPRFERAEWQLPD